MTRAIVMVLTLLLAGGAWAAGELDLLIELHDATARGHCAQATALVRAIEEAGESRALIGLGGRLEEGRRCLEPDLSRAARLYERAAAAGEAVAMARLGRLHGEGRGVARDVALARYWFRAAVLAMVLIEPPRRRELLAMALEGEIPDLLAQQLTWLSLIELGGPASQLELALRMRSGDGVPRNEVAAEHLMGRLAADQHPPALYEHGRWLLAKAETHDDRWRAFRSMEMAANRGHLPAMLDLAQRMLDGGDLETNDYWTYVAFLKARALGANVDPELSLLEERLDLLEIEAAREQARESDIFPTARVRD